MKSDRYQNRIELLQGTLDLLVLQTLVWGPQHGYGISQVISTRSGDVLAADTGSLYPALHRLDANAGSPPNGKCPKTNNACASTNLPDWAASNLPMNARAGRALPKPSPEF